ncbi:hypothetical protein GCM10027174_24220 [Salinifilum aidingensis]
MQVLLRIYAECLAGQEEAALAVAEFLAEGWRERPRQIFAVHLP